MWTIYRWNSFLGCITKCRWLIDWLILINFKIIFSLKQEFFSPETQMEFESRVFCLQLSIIISLDWLIVRKKKDFGVLIQLSEMMFFSFETFLSKDSIQRKKLNFHQKKVKKKSTELQKVHDNKNKKKGTGHSKNQRQKTGTSHTTPYKLIVCTI